MSRSSTVYRCSRIRLGTRPLRPPSRPADDIVQSSIYSNQRMVTTRSMIQRLRPQIPYLSSVSLQSSALPSRPWQLVRPITTEKVRLLRKTAWDLWMALSLVAVVLPSTLAIMWWASHEMMERDYPTPQQWSFRSRCYWHTVKGLADRSVTRGRIPDWSVIAHALQALLARLEDPDIDGAGLRLCRGLDIQSDPPVHVAFDLSSVYDITSMSEQWCRSYFQTLLEAAKTAEAAERMVFDTSTQGLHMLEFVVGPSNPDPVPLPPAAHIAAPLEQNCIRYYPSANGFYVKLLSTVGLTDRQRIEALISYGEWLNTKGESDLAECQFRDAVKTAGRNLKSPSTVFDGNTGIVRHDAPYITANLMDAVTALAVHLARNKRTNEALPIFLSTVQAYRGSTTRPETKPRDQHAYSGVIPSEVLMAGLRARLSGLFSAVEYPSAPTSGNEPLQRTGDEYCKASAAMLYAGEVLFAMSESQRETALGWMREVLHIASQRVSDTSVPMGDRQQCNQCISVALDTWWSMAQKMRAEELTAVGTGLSVYEDDSNVPRWRHEELEHWEWAKQNDRAQWDEKLMFEQWKIWSWFPEFTLRSII